jgi:hypothetical protein
MMNFGYAGSSRLILIKKYKILGKSNMFSEIIEQLTSTKAKTLTGYSFVNNIL